MLKVICGVLTALFFANVSLGDYDWHTDPANGHTYAITNVYGTWEQCEAEAEAAGGHLVTINDVAENRWVSVTFSELSYSRNHQGWGVRNVAWIGFSNTASGWQWADEDEDSTFMNTCTRWRPVHGEYAYIKLSHHPEPEKWGDRPYYVSHYKGNPRGIIEVSNNAGDPNSPEPATLALLGAGGLMLLRRRRA